jgi:hypothetical protein
VTCNAIHAASPAPRRSQGRPAAPALSPASAPASPRLQLAEHVAVTEARTAALVTGVDALIAEVAALSRERVTERVRLRLAEALRAGRIDRAEHDRLTAPAQLARLAEPGAEMFLDALDARSPRPVRPPQPDALALSERVRALQAEAKAHGRRLSPLAAAAQAASEATSA